MIYSYDIFIYIYSSTYIHLHIHLTYYSSNIHRQIVSFFGGDFFDGDEGDRDFDDFESPSNGRVKRAARGQCRSKIWLDMVVDVARYGCMVIECHMARYA